MITVIFNTIFTMLRIIEVLAIVAVFMSWIMPRSEVRMKLEWLLSPFMAPFRWLNMKITARTRMPLDFSYMFLLLGIELARGILTRLMIFLLYH